MPTALITGITGQDGSYLAEHLLDLGYRLSGSRGGPAPIPGVASSTCATASRSTSADLLDQTSLLALVDRVQAGRGLQPRRPELRPGLVRATGAHRRVHRARRHAPAGSGPSGQAGGPRSTRPRHPKCLARSRRSPRTRRPRSIRGRHTASRSSTATGFTVNYRESYGLHASSGILFNHESAATRAGVRDPQDLATASPGSSSGLDRELRLGNLDARRDWGFAGDYVRAMHLMLQQPEPGDYVVATGETHSVREFCEAALSRLPVCNGRTTSSIDPDLLPARRSRSVGRRCQPGARPSSVGLPTVGFRELVAMMVEADLALVADGRETRFDPLPTESGWLAPHHGCLDHGHNGAGRVLSRQSPARVGAEVWGTSRRGTLPPELGVCNSSRSAGRQRDQATHRTGDHGRHSGRNLPPRRPVIGRRIMGRPGPNRRGHGPRHGSDCSKPYGASRQRHGVFLASSSEIFGYPDRAPQNESTAIRPVSPYGAAKAYSHHVAAIYRQRYDFYVAMEFCTTTNHPAEPLISSRKRSCKGRCRSPAAAVRAAPGQPRGPARLGLCRRLRAGHAPDAAAA